MSVLNHMLRDLDRRQALDDGSTGHPLNGVVLTHPAVRPLRPPRPGFLYGLLAALTLVAGLVVGQGRLGAPAAPEPAGVFPRPIRVTPFNPPDDSERVRVVARSAKGVALRLASAMSEPARFAPAAARPPAADVRLRVEQSPRRARVHLIMARPLEYQVAVSRDPARLMVRLPSGAGTPRLSGSLSPGLIRDLRSDPADGGQHVLVMALSAPATLKDRGYGQSEDGRRLLTLELEALPEPSSPKLLEGRQAYDLAVTPRTASLERPVMEKRPVHPAPETMAGARYQSALEHLEAGDAAGAERLLRAALDIVPGHRGAITLLSSLFGQDGRYAQAGKLLDKALAVSPDDTVLLEAKARLLADQGRTTEALDLLDPQRVSVRDGMDYHALRAALLNQVGDMQGAVALYRELVGLRPGRGLWWLGMGTSLEASGQTKEALSAYHKALLGDGLEGSLRGFVNRRIEALAAGG